MKINRKEIKTKAKTDFSARYGMHILCYLIFTVLLSVASEILIFVFGPLLVGQNAVYRKSSKAEKFTPADLFSGFKKYGRSLGAGVLQLVFTTLWSLLLIVPGIIKAFSYNLTPYIIDVDDTKGPKEAINLSKAMMKGYKGQYFVLVLSFLGWNILSLFTFGILDLLYVGPYQAQTFYNFREKVYNEYMAKNQQPQEAKK